MHHRLVFLIILVTVQFITCMNLAHRSRKNKSHIVIYRQHHEDVDLFADHRVPPEEQVTFWIENEEFQLEYDDGNEILIEYHDSVDQPSSIMTKILFDVTVNNKFTHTCVYKDASQQEGVLLHILKEGQNIRIAQSDVSICTLAFGQDTTYDFLTADATEIRQRLKRRTGMPQASLRVRLLKSKLDMSKYPRPKKQVRWADLE